MRLFKTQKQIIAEIHNEFNSAQDRLLSEAENILSKINLPNKSEKEEVANRLKSIGFINNPLVKQCDLIAKEREESKITLVKTEEEANIIRHYKYTYPFLKFVTEGELDRICNKYKLIHAPVKNYIKEVPEKNLRDIEKAQSLHELDVREKRRILKVSQHMRSVDEKIKEFLDSGIEIPGNIGGYDFQIESWVREYLVSVGFPKFIHVYYTANVESIDMSGLFIAAPKSHFDLGKLKKKSKYGFFDVEIFEVKDPIVFRYVKGGIQILTMWGLEASDQSLLNPVNN